MATCVSKQTNKRQILGAVMGNTKPPVLKGSTPSQLAELLDKMKLQLESKIDALHGDCIDEKNKLKDVFAAAMVKIPRNVKSMRVAEFNALYKCDILSVIENLPVQAAGKKRDRLETPSQQTTAGGRVPLATPSRTVRKGEMLFSKNGTPIEGPEDAAIIATVTKAKKRRTGSTGDGAASASLDINIGGGQFLSLQDPNNIDTLDGHEKNMAVQQLQMLREQVDFYLKRMEGN